MAGFVESKGYSEKKSRRCDAKGTIQDKLRLVTKIPSCLEYLRSCYAYLEVVFLPDTCSILEDGPGEIELIVLALRVKPVLYVLLRWDSDIDAMSFAIVLSVETMIVGREDVVSEVRFQIALGRGQRGRYLSGICTALRE